MKYVSVGDAAKRLGVSVEVVRSLVEAGELKSIRTGGGHRRIPDEDVERRRTAQRATRSNPKASRLGSKRRTAVPPAGRPRHVEPHPRDREFEEDAPTLEELDAELERQQAKERAEGERQRLEGWKKYGRELARYTGLPAEWHAKVIESLEEFVTAKRIPATLSDWEAKQIVQAQVNFLVKQYWSDLHERQQKDRDAAEARRRADEERQRIEEERRQKEREAVEQRRKQDEDEQRLQSLISHGNSRAWSETFTGWDYSEAQRARRDVERALKDEVKADWSEAEVEDLVDDVLYEGDEDEEDEGEEEDDDEN